MVTNVVAYGVLVALYSLHVPTKFHVTQCFSVAYWKSLTEMYPQEKGENTLLLYFVSRSVAHHHK